MKPSKQGPPNEDIYAALGRLVYAFAHLEGSLLRALARSLGDTDEAHIVLSGIAFPQLIDRFSVLYAAVDHPLVLDGKLAAFAATLSRLNEARNRHFHSVWGFWLSGDPARYRNRLQRNKGMALSMETVRPEEVAKLAEEMNQAAETVEQLRERYRKAQPWSGQ